MKISNNTIYALDFDGVICDSAVETGITGWKAATQIWSDMTGSYPEDWLLDSFRSVRPVLETGYESILIMRLLHLGVDQDTMIKNYAATIDSLLNSENLNIDDLKILFGTTRDAWINDDLQDWIAMNPLFPGVAEKLNRLNSTETWYIVTTKQERFVKQILHANQIELTKERIYGLDRNISKQEALTQLLQIHVGQPLCFVEDRFPTLNRILQNKSLQYVQLYLADWGYISEQDRANVNNSRITLITIDQFLG